MRITFGLIFANIIRVQGSCLFLVWWWWGGGVGVWGILFQVSLGGGGHMVVFKSSGVSYVFFYFYFIYLFLPGSYVF